MCVQWTVVEETHQKEENLQLSELVSYLMGKKNTRIFVPLKFAKTIQRHRRMMDLLLAANISMPAVNIDSKY